MRPRGQRRRLKVSPQMGPGSRSGADNPDGVADPDLTGSQHPREHPATAGHPRPEARAERVDEGAGLAVLRDLDLGRPDLEVRAGRERLEVEATGHDVLPDLSGREAESVAVLLGHEEHLTGASGPRVVIVLDAQIRHECERRDPGHGFLLLGSELKENHLGHGVYYDASQVRCLDLWIGAILMGLSCGPAEAQGSAGEMTLWRGRSTEPFTSATHRVGPFDRAVLSWNATGAAAFELEVDGRWHLMGRWGDTPGSAKTGAVDVDTLVLGAPQTSFRFRATPERGAAITLVAVATWRKGARRPFSENRSAAWGKVLDVPRRSQVQEATDPGSICSPTSLSMVLEFHGVNRTTREVCEGVYDHAEKIYGNWPLNTAYAHKVGGFEAFVARLGGLEEIEEEISAGRPVVLSHRWGPGDLDGAPIAASDGHLIVVVGFTAEGDVVANDPASKPDGVRRTYRRRQLWTTFLERGAGIVYFVRPR
jgi:hypothetical protein